MFIEGFGLANYRSFGPDIQLIGPLSKINLFAGPNNTGKSNVLIFLLKHYAEILEAVGMHAAYTKMDGLDRHLGRYGESSSFAVGLDLKSNFSTQWTEQLLKQWKERSQYQQLVGLANRVYSAVANKDSFACFFIRGVGLRCRWHILRPTGLWRLFRATNGSCFGMLSRRKEAVA